MWVLVLATLTATALAVRSWRGSRAMESELRFLRARVRELSARLASVEQSARAARSEPVANRSVLAAKGLADEEDPEADHGARGPRTVH
jgi:hypothetical protein